MNYNMPFPNFDPFIKINMLEQEIIKLKSKINTLEERINSIENTHNKNGYLNSNVGNNNDSLYML